MASNAPLKKYTYIGFCVGAAIPICFVAYALLTQPPPPSPDDAWPNGPYECGLGSLAPVIAIVFGVPLFGIIGATIGYLLARKSGNV